MIKSMGLLQPIRLPAHQLHQRPTTSSWWCSPLFNGMGRNGRTDLPRGSTKRLPPLSLTVFSLGCSLAGRGWAAPFLIDWTPIRQLLILALLLIGGGVYCSSSPISSHPGPGCPCSICHVDVGRDALWCSACLRWVHFLGSSLTRADFHTVCAAGAAVGWHCSACCSRGQANSPASTSFPIASSASPPPPLPGFPLLPPGFCWPCPPRSPPRYPCSMCSHEVGKDLLKCSACSRWVHFSCSSLTRANFHKICAAGSTVGWNFPACLNGDLASPIYQQASPHLSSPASPPPTPPHQHV